MSSTTAGLGKYLVSQSIACKVGQTVLSLQGCFRNKGNPPYTSSVSRPGTRSILCFGLLKYFCTMRYLGEEIQDYTQHLVMFPINIEPHTFSVCLRFGCDLPQTARCGIFFCGVTSVCKRCFWSSKRTCNRKTGGPIFWGTKQIWTLLFVWILLEKALITSNLTFRNKKQKRTPPDSNFESCKSQGSGLHKHSASLPFLQAFCWVGYVEKAGFRVTLPSSTLPADYFYCGIGNFPFCPNFDF